MSDQPHADQSTHDTPEAQPSPMSPKRKRRILLISGGVLLAFSLYLLAFLVPDVIKTAGGPERMTMARAAEVATGDSTYATIEDGVWHCDTITYIRGRSSSNRQRIETRYTEIFVTDAANPPQIALLATLSGRKECDDLQGTTLSGYLTRMSGGKQQELANEVRLAQFYDATVFLEFCGYCGTGNSLIGVAFGVVFGMGGVALLAFGFRIPREVSAPPQAR